MIVMKFFQVIIFTLSASFFPSLSTGQELPKLYPKSTNISFEAKDGVKVYGEFIKVDNSNPTILLFHQGGSNSRGEYIPIVPRLVEEGYNVLAVDQRQGGQVFGSYNRTVAELTNNYSFCEAYDDLIGALNFVSEQGFSKNIILWGSSYSGSLAVKLASERGEKVSGVLAFSPATGGPMAECKADLYFDNLNVPLLLLRPSQELEIESSKLQFETARKKGFQVYEAETGTHGSSMLVEERTGGNTEENWQVVLSFLNSIKE